jgi:hypothetical protein
VSALVLGLFGACLAIGGGSRRNWQAADWKSNNRRIWLLTTGFAVLAIIVGGFVATLGIELGLAWFLIWLTLSAFGASLWISFKPRTVPWIGSILLIASIILFVAT